MRCVEPESREGKIDTALPRQSYNTATNPVRKLRETLAKRFDACHFDAG